MWKGYYSSIKAFLKEKRSQEGYGWFWVIGLILVLLAVVVIIYVMAKGGQVGREQLGILG